MFTLSVGLSFWAFLAEERGFKRVRLIISDACLGLIPFLVATSVKVELIENIGTFGYSVSTALKAPKCAENTP